MRKKMAMSPEMRKKVYSLNYVIRSVHVRLRRKLARKLKLVVRLLRIIHSHV